LVEYYYVEVWVPVYPYGGYYDYLFEDEFGYSLVPIESGTPGIIEFAPCIFEEIIAEVIGMDWAYSAAEVSTAYFTNTGNNTVPVEGSNCENCVNWANLYAAGDPPGGAFGWSTTSNKVELVGGGSIATVYGEQQSAPGGNDVPIQVTYTVNGIESTPATVNFTVQEPTAMSYLQTTLSGSENDTNYHDCTNSNYPTGLYRDINWQVVDRDTAAIDFSMPGMDTGTYSPTQNGLGLGTFVGSTGYTTGAGVWPHHYWFCVPSTTCPGNGVTDGTQYFTFNGFPGINLPFVFSCTSITVNGN
jgi:hypothetical protein